MRSNISGLIDITTGDLDLLEEAIEVALLLGQQADAGHVARLAALEARRLGLVHLGSAEVEASLTAEIVCSEDSLVRAELGSMSSELGRHLGSRNLRTHFGFEGVHAEIVRRLSHFF